MAYNNMGLTMLLHADFRLATKGQLFPWNGQAQTCSNKHIVAMGSFHELLGAHTHAVNRLN